MPTDEALAAARQPVTAAGWRPEEPVRLGVRAEGAPWLGPQVHALWPSAVEILDSDQGCAPLDTVAGRPDRDHPERPDDGGEAAVARLFWGAGPGVIWGRQRMHPAEAPAADESAQLRRSLPRHQARLDDRLARQAGAPIGSGGSESAHTCMGQVRRQRVGAWWDGDPRQPEAGLTRRTRPRPRCARVCSLPATHPPTLRRKAS